MANLENGAPTTNLGVRTLKGSFWIVLGKGYQQILLLCKVTILGRLLGPEEFGLVGIAFLTIQFMTTFTHTGFASAMIQKPDLQDIEINTAWWVLLGRGALIALILWVLGPWIAAIFHEPRAIPVLRAFGGIQILSAFTSIGVVLLSKNLDFRAAFKYDAWGTALELVVSVAIAFWYRTVWALVWGALAGTLARLIASYVICPYLPRLAFNGRSARELFKFGQWILLANVMIFVFTRTTDAMSGIMFGAAALGLYQMASRFGMMATNHVGDLFLVVIFPAYSLIQNDPAKLKQTFLKVLQVASFVLFPVTVLMILTVAPLLPVLLGAKWQGVVSLVPGVALGGLIQALLRTGSPLFLATGKPRLQFTMDAASALGILLFIFPFSKYFGLEGLAWSYAAGTGLGLPLWWCFIKRQSKSSTGEIAVSILPTILASSTLGLAIFTMNRILLTEQFFIGHLLFAVLGLLLFLGITLLLERLVPGYKPMGSTLTLIKDHLRRPGQPQMEGVC
ncbi:MAG: lipopolysaccharide biosynthesis protein [Desulfobaccales bacterium]